MADSSLLKEILDSLNDSDAVQLFAAANGLVGDAEVEDRLKELNWEKHIEDLWQEVLSEMESPAKKSRPTLADGDQPSTSVQLGGGEESSDSEVTSEKPYYIWKRDTRTFKKHWVRDTTFKVKFNEQWRGKKLIDIQNNLHDMFDDLLSQARGHDADLGRVVISHPSLNNAIVVPLQSWETLNADAVMSEIVKVLNSNESLPIDESLLVTIGSIDLPKGGGNPRKLPITSLFGPKNSIERKKSLFHVQNDNNLCMAISIGLCFLKTCKKVDADTWSQLVKNDSNEEMLDDVLKHRTESKAYYNNVLKTSRKKKQTELAMWLCQRAGVPTDRYLGLNDIEPFETLLNVSINVVSSRVGNKFVRVTKDQEKPRLYLYHIDSENEKHWHGIASIQGFFKASYFCHTCLKPYKDKSKHSCATSCEVCLRNNCPETDVQMGCRSCGRVCRSLVCFKSHKEQRTVKNESYPPACDLFYQCTKCRVVLERVKRSPELHVCEEWQCPNCREYQTGEHNCYQKPFGSDIEKRNKKFFFYDFETRQDDVFQCEAGYSPSRVRCRHCVKEPRQCVNCRLCQNCRDPSCGLMQHKVNFAVLQSTCHQCEKEELVEDATCSHCGTRCGKCSRTLKGEYVSPPCQDTCGKRELVFSGDYAAEHFCAYVTRKHCKDSILIAHNAKSFDLYPVLEVLIDRHSIRPSKIIYNGSKIMYMHIAQKLNLTFMDSLNFLPMKLAKIPEAFGLQELCKGYFPHLFNTKAHQNYVGPYPDLQYYGYQFLSTEERKKLEDWHATKKDETFHFREEMLQYCRSDVDILRRGCLEFRKLMIDVTTIEENVAQADGTLKTQTTYGVDPFDYVTIASVCMGVFKSLFLKGKEKIQITKDGDTKWYDIEHLRGLQVVNVEEESWVSLVDLQHDENVQIGKRQFESPIAVVPSQGYTKRDNYSKVSIQWLEWLMEKSRQRGNPIHISHALNGGEYQIPGTNYRCDGFVPSPTGKGTVYEFYGKTINLHIFNIYPLSPSIEGGGGGRRRRIEC